MVHSPSAHTQPGSSLPVLVLPLKGEYFDAIRDGSKPEEFRLVNDYWTKRMIGPGGAHRCFDHIVLTKGYPAKGDASRRLIRPWVGFVRKTLTHPHFGPDPVKVFAIDVRGEAAVSTTSQPGTNGEAGSEQ